MARPLSEVMKIPGGYSSFPNSLARKYFDLSPTTRSLIYGLWSCVWSSDWKKGVKDWRDKKNCVRKVTVLLGSCGTRTYHLCENQTLFSSREAARLFNLSHTSVLRGMEELETRGLIKVQRLCLKDGSEEADPTSTRVLLLVTIIPELSPAGSEVEDFDPAGEPAGKSS
jgi:hypothetical protein